ncbi:MAG: SAM-dependent methyltransferase [SAR86 cluster bacterium]|uniref:SAM-dependent methyltransferase n=1 Tax=SAR86 cluster bacterium TaxID=2030880 RepID=A0A2A5B471_9GAMM|nr:MAG: SAM-dependent methyltransferase [SAR86 cluster bacterium]
MKHFTKICFGLLILLASTAHINALDTEALLRAISGSDREVTDYARDAARKPVEVLNFLGLEAGMTVLDLYAAGGYYTFILSKAVGPDGIVYAQNTPRGLRFEEDRQNITQGEALDTKIQRGELNNVTQIVRPLREIDLPENSLDMVIIAQTLHDSYNPNPQRALEMLLQIKALVKPGGVVGITDHVGVAGRNNRELHRMQTQQAIDVAEQAGFTVEVSDLLHSPNDDHRRSIFDPSLNRNTDRFLLKLRKPL